MPNLPLAKIIGLCEKTEKTLPGFTLSCFIVQLAGLTQQKWPSGNEPSDIQIWKFLRLSELDLDMVFDLSFKQKRRSAPSNSSTPVERYLRRSYLPKKGNSRLEHSRFPSLVLCPLHPIWSTPSRPNFFNIHPPYSQNAYTAPHYPQFQTFRDIKPHSLSRRQTIEKRPFPTATRDF